MGSVLSAADVLEEPAVIVDGQVAVATISAVDSAAVAAICSTANTEPALC